MTTLAVAVTGRGLVPVDAPVLPADDEALARGRAVFETTRVYGGRPFKLAEHLDRLGFSAERMGLEPPPRAGLEELVRLALAGAAAPESVLRLYWTPGGTGIALVAGLPPELEELRARGLRLVSLVGPVVSAPWLLGGVKSTSYAVNMAAQAEAQRRGADDALLVTAEDVVLEGPTTNVWWRRGETLYTPALELGILAGVTRATIIELSARDVQEGSFALEEMAVAAEIFTSSSIREVMPVTELDGRRIARGPAADELQEALRRYASLR
jgi:4-amino-4-deoxychorismate lyase